MYCSLDKTSDIPAFQQIIDAVCGAVREGQIGAGEQIDTEQTTAKRLGVSRPTVSKAYEKLRWLGIIESTRGRGSIIATSAYEALGVKAYKPMRKIAYLVSAVDRMSQIPLMNRHIIYDTLEGISHRLESTSATLSYICMGRKNEKKITTQEKARLEYQLKAFDGALLLAEPKSADPVIPIIKNLKLPCVRLYEPSQNLKIPHVIYDRAGAVKLGVKHLINQGYQRIGYIGTDDREVEGERAKYSAFFEALQAHGLKANQEDVWLVKDHDARSTVEKHLQKIVGSQRAGIRLPSSYSLPQAFFIGSDYYAMQALSVFQFAGITIPEDLAIMSYDDVAETALITPALSTVHVPRHSIGYDAADLLFNWPVDNSAIPKSKVLYADISQRETIAISTGRTGAKARH